MRLIRTTVRILNVKNELRNHSLKTNSIPLKLDHIESAVEFWVKLCQNDIRADLEKAVTGEGPFKSLKVIENDNGIFFAQVRTQKWNEMSYNSVELPILPILPIF